MVCHVNAYITINAIALTITLHLDILSFEKVASTHDNFHIDCQYLKKTYSSI